MGLKILFGLHPVGCSCCSSHKLSAPHSFPHFQILQTLLLCGWMKKMGKRQKQSRSYDRVISVKHSQSDGFQRGPRVGQFPKLLLQTCEQLFWTFSSLKNLTVAWSLQVEGKLLSLLWIWKRNCSWVCHDKGQGLNFVGYSQIFKVYFYLSKIASFI